MKRMLVFAVAAVTVWTAENLWLTSRQPQISSALAMQQLNGGTRAAAELRTFEMLKDSVHVLGSSVILATALFCFAPWIRRAGRGAWRVIARTKLGRRLAGGMLPALLALVL